MGSFTRPDFAEASACSYPASAWRRMPIIGSLFSTRERRLAADSVPSAMNGGRCRTMPTKPLPSQKPGQLLVGQFAVAQHLPQQARADRFAGMDR
jgi:hypothetical protein